MVVNGFYTAKISGKNNALIYLQKFLNQHTLVSLNKKQLRLIKNTSFFEEKRAVIEEIEIIMALICEDLKELYANKAKKVSIAPEKIASKITRGENLKGLPYLILDFPQQFSKTEIFSFRLLFWWGNGFTLFLHLKNDQLEPIKELMLKEMETLTKEGFYISTSGNEWEHEYLAPNYRKIDDYKADEPLNFIKFAFPVDFNQSTDLKLIIKQKTAFLLALLSKI